jgi:hypothetical protein
LKRANDDFSAGKVFLRHGFRAQKRSRPA